MNREVTVLLDNGHGGLIGGVYQTPGKRSPVWPDGTQLFEGEFNRAIVNRIVEELDFMRIKYVRICPEDRDVTLSTRVARANRYYYNISKKCFFISVHSNAGGGKGCEVFTSPGQTKSDPIATIWGHEFKLEYPDSRLRSELSDGDIDKEAKFRVLTGTAMPAILTENFFFDNKAECKNILMNRGHRDRIASIHVKTILRTIEELY